MSRSPQVLAAFAKTHLLAIHGCGESLAERVLGSCTPESIAAIESCSRISWVPIEHHIEVNDAVFADVGSSRAREIARCAVVESFNQPFLKPLFKGALAVLGTELGRFASWAPKAWPALFRGVGDLRWVVEGEGKGHLLLTDVEPCVLSSDTYLEGLAGGFSAMLEVTETRGEVAMTRSDDQVTFGFHWKS